MSESNSEIDQLLQPAIQKEEELKKQGVSRRGFLGGLVRAVGFVGAMSVGGGVLHKAIEKRYVEPKHIEPEEIWIGDPLDSLTIARGEQSGIEEPMYKIITTKEEFREVEDLILKNQPRFSEILFSIRFPA